MFEKLRTAKRAVLLWSGGLDSTLLLAMLREQPIDFDIVQFREFWTKDQLKKSDDLIRQWDLKVFSYPAANVYFIGQGDEISTVFEMAIGGVRMPLIKDVIPGTRCIADLDGQKLQRSPISWDLWMIGSRKYDRHYAFENQVIPGKEWQVGSATMYAPLYDFSREDVKRELIVRGLDADEISEQTDGGNIALCSNCLHGEEAFCPLENKTIPPVQWQPEVNLALFRQAYA